MRLPYLAVSAVHLAAQLRAPEGRVATLTQALLMPTLAGGLASAPRDRTTALTLGALGLSWAGDTVPRFASEEAELPVLVGCFLGAQGAYAAAFWPDRRASVLRRPATLGAYVVAAGGLVAWIGADRPAWTVPAAVYAGALTATGVLATGLGRTAGVGGALFMVSDALIAARELRGVEVPAHGFWVMGTYAAAQGLLVEAVRRRRRP